MKVLLLFGIILFGLWVYANSNQNYEAIKMQKRLGLFALSKKNRYDMYVESAKSKPAFNQTINTSNVPKPLIKEFYFAAQLASIAYYTTDTEIMNALSKFNITFKAYLQNASCQVYIGELKGTTILAIRGTEFTEAHHNIWEVWDDLRDTPTFTNPKGTFAHSGFYDDLYGLWPSIKPYFENVENVWVIGHSLGGVRAHLVRSFLSSQTKVRITTFGAPMGANYSFWDFYESGANTKVERVVAERDFAPSYPWLLPYIHPTESFYWITQGQINLVNERDYLNLSLADHRLTTSYLPLLEALLD